MSEIKKEIVEDDEAYLIVSEHDVKKIATPDTVWAKISDDGELEIIRWDIIEMYALEYDMQARAKQQHSQTHVICKLLLLVRNQERKQHASK
jgi:sulfur transfer complex TusBCD TusB component (DsrH family)